MTHRTFLLAGFLVLTAAAQAQWSHFHGSIERNGRTSVIGPTSPVQQWAVDFGYPVATSPVVGPDGTIYIGPLPDLKNAKPRTYLNAINPNGTFKWRYELPYSDIAGISTPTIDSAGNLYFADATGKLLSLSPSGTLRWQFQGARPNDSHPLAVGNDTVYFQNGSSLINLDSATGFVRWTVDLGADIPGGPTADQSGNIYTVSGTGIRSYAPSGALRWNSGISGSASPPAIGGDGHVYVAGGQLRKLNAATGALVWSVGSSLNGTVAPTLDTAGNVYYCKTWSIVKVNSDGVQMWEHNIEESNFLGYSNSASIVDPAGRLYTCLGWYRRAALSIEKRLICLNSATGGILWFRNLPEIGSPSSPAIGADGTLYVGCTDGKLYAFR